MDERERNLLIEEIYGRKDRGREYSPSPFLREDEKTGIPIGEGICIEQGFNGKGDFHLSIISADDAKDLICRLTLQIEDRLAYLEGYINEGDGSEDRQIYYLLKPLTHEQFARLGRNVVPRRALKVSDEDLLLFKKLKNDPAGNLETAQSLLRRFRHQASH